MRRLRYWLSIATTILVLCTVTARADDSVFVHGASVSELSSLLGKSAQRVAGAPAIRGRFEQRKYLAELPQPLVSTGEFLFVRDKGVWWHTQTPFDSVFILTREGMRNRDGSGAELKISAAEQPGIAAVARIFFALFALDFNTLASDFDTYGRGTPADWQVGLRPRLAALATVFRDARIDGGEQVRSIELRDAHDDRTDIILAGVDVLKDLSAEESGRFSP
jgi:hypothetical protein